MAFTPDQPFPKSPGNPIMAKDWNDSIAELQRLDTAKVNRTGADTLSGPLTISAALNVGSSLAVGSTTAPAAGTRLHVLDTATPAIARVQTTATNGSSRLELWSDPRNSDTEWRPGYLESFDGGTAGTYTGGLRFVTNGTGLANRTGASEQLRLVNGAAGFGVPDPAFRIDALGRLRIRQPPGGDSAGLWLYQATPAANRAFIGMMNDNTLGLFGAASLWSFQMDVGTGNVGIKTSPTPTSALTIAGDAVMTGLTANGNAMIGGITGMGIANSSGLRLEMSGRMRIREGIGGSAGIWFFQNAANADRGFVGMANDNQIGLYGTAGAGFGLLMDTSNANVQVQGRVWDQKYAVELAAAGNVATSAGFYTQVPNMAVTFNLPFQRWVWIIFHMPGVQMTGGDGGHSAGSFRISIDSTEVASTRNEWHNAGWELRSVFLTRRWLLTAGTHTVRAEWAVSAGGGTLTGCWYSGQGVPPGGFGTIPGNYQEFRTLQVWEQ